MFGQLEEGARESKRVTVARRRCLLPVSSDAGERACAPERSVWIFSPSEYHCQADGTCVDPMHWSWL